MESRKRKAPLQLIRRVRPRKEEQGFEVEDWEGVSDQDQGEISEEGSEDESEDESENDDKSDGSSSPSSSSREDSPEPELDTSKISFGALAKAQASIRPSKKRKGASEANSEDQDDGDDDDDEPLDGRWGDRQPAPKAGGAAVSGRKAPKPPARKSKHAPEEVTSKRQVSRYREVVKPLGGSRPAPRDPRFDRALDTAEDLARFRRDYGFLDEYRASELARLRRALASARDERQRDELKRSVASMESQRRARERRDEQERVVVEHRRREKELVRKGKKPFYLKEKEKKRMVLVERFKGMSKGQAERAIERRRKKEAGKEKKALPYGRRGAGG